MSGLTFYSIGFLIAWPWSAIMLGNLLFIAHGHELSEFTAELSPRMALFVYLILAIMICWLACACAIFWPVIGGAAMTYGWSPRKAAEHIAQ